MITILQILLRPEKQPTLVRNASFMLASEFCVFNYVCSLLRLGVFIDYAV